MTDTTNMEFGVLPDNWVISTLDDFVRKESSIRYGIVQPGDYDPEGRFMVRGQDYSKGWNAPHTIFRVSPKIEERYKNARLSAGDLIMTIVGACGHIEVVPNWLDGANITQTTARIPLKRELISTTYVLNFFRFHFGLNQVKNHIKGAVQPGLNIGDVRNFKVVCPPIEEQKAIAEVLSDVDELIAQTERLIAKKEAIKMGVMQELLRPKEGWVQKPLGDLATITMGQSPSSHFYNQDGDGLPLVQGNADVKGRKTIARVFTSQVTKRAKRGHVLVSVRAPVGAVSRAEFDCCIGRGVCAVDYINDFIFHYLIFKENSWKEFSSGTTFDSVTSSQVAQFPINIPGDIREQIKISDTLSLLDSEIELLRVKLRKMSETKSGIQDQLLTGKTRLV